MATRDSDSARHLGVVREVGRAPKIDPTTSRVLRQLGSRLNCTDSLVSLYNETDDEQERNALRKWLCAYRPYFNERCPNCHGSGVLEEMADLARIKVCCSEDEELVLDLLNFLASQVRGSVVHVKKTVSPLARALGEIDESIFHGDVCPILEIVKVLFSKLDTRFSVFTRETYSTHSMSLFALHRCLLIIQQIAPGILDPQMEEGVFQIYMTHLSNVIKHQTFFPLLFHAKLVEQCMVRLADDGVFADAIVSGRTLTFLSGCTYGYASLRKAFIADLDLDSLKKASHNFRKATAGLPEKEVWYDEYVKLNAMTVLSCKNAALCTDVDVFFQSALGTENDLSNSRERNLLRFGIVDQLHFIALNGKSSEIRRFAATELAHLGQRYISCEGWDEEPAVVEGIVLALKDLAVNTEHNKVAETALEVLHARKDAVVQDALNRLSRNGVPESIILIPKEKKICVDDVFHLARASIKIYDHEQARDKSHDLKMRYMNNEFSTVGLNMLW